MGAMSLEQIRDYIEYNADTGVFTVKAWWSSRREVGDRIDYVFGDGRYHKVWFQYKQYLAHKLAWWYMTNEWTLIDHINRDGTDNRFNNLRPTTPQGNGANRGLFKNNNSGFKGVSLCQRTNKWVAGIKVNGKSSYLGQFNTPEEAHEVYKTAAIKYFGEFARFE